MPAVLEEIVGVGAFGATGGCATTDRPATCGRAESTTSRRMWSQSPMLYHR